MIFLEVTAKVNETNLDLVTVVWSEDTIEICYSEKCPGGILGVKNKSRCFMQPRRAVRIAARLSDYDSSFTWSRIEKKTMDTMLESRPIIKTFKHHATKARIRLENSAGYSSLAHSPASRKINYC